MQLRLPFLLLILLSIDAVYYLTVPSPKRMFGAYISEQIEDLGFLFLVPFLLNLALSLIIVFFRRQQISLASSAWVVTFSLFSPFVSFILSAIGLCILKDSCL